MASIPIVDLIAALEASSPGDVTRIESARQLLTAALENADLDAALLVARFVDQDPALDAALAPDFDQALHNQPDAVYRFVRARLALSPDERWRFRLRQAALAALHVAITDADAETVLSWLTLIAREPAQYDLSDVLHHGLLAAHTRALEDPTLARDILLIALRRDYAAASQFIADPDIRAALPAELAGLLYGGASDALNVLSAYGSDVFLAALARAAEDKRADSFTIPVIEQLWHFYTGGAGGTLPPASQPAIIINNWTNDAAWLPNPVFDHLLALALRADRDALASALVRQLIPQPDALNRLANALFKSALTPDQIVNQLGRISAAGLITPTEHARLTEALIQRFGWGASALPLVHHWGRLNKSAQDMPDEERLWLMLAFATAQDHPDELAASAALRFLSARIERIEDEKQIAESLARLLSHLETLPDVRAELLAWWRRTMLAQPVARLSKLGEALAKYETLADASAVIETIQALRRLIGKRTLAQFAQDVHAALAILQALSDAFDGESKRALRFDPRTMRDELARLRDTLSDQEHHILSTDLKELARVIGVLGDRRSKPNLIRREEEIDRQIMQGEQPPHGGVDVLKWLSGYLDGLQDSVKDAH